MSSVIVGKVIGVIIQSITIFVFIDIILQHNLKLTKFSLRNILSLIFLTISMLLIYSTEYSSINTISMFLVIVMDLYIIHKIKLSKSFLCAGLFMIFLFLSDFIMSLVWMGFLKVEDIRSIPFYFVISNFFVGVITISLEEIRPIKRHLIKIIEITENKENFETMAFILLLLLALSIIVYMISKNYTFDSFLILYILGILIFIALTFIFFREKFEKEKIVNKYDELFEYVKTFEDWMDTEKLNIHESKNQLATLRDMVKKNKKAVEYIDNIIKERINIKSGNTEKLRYIPKGGLKGLLCYKVTLAENNKINLLIDVSKNSEDVLKTLSVDENKMLCRLVGIFFDNAIESSKESEKKIISCEIYPSGNNLNIIISNTFAGKINLNKITENGYSTKGKNRGKGLYLAKKFSAKYDKFDLENRIINDYYIQKIIIKRI